jgi:hypothetical protein
MVMGRVLGQGILFIINFTQRMMVLCSIPYRGGIRVRIHCKVRINQKTCTFARFFTPCGGSE